jgi:NAD(P)H dehydrogenase (quinone)
MLLPYAAYIATIDKRTSPPRFALAESGEPRPAVAARVRCGRRPRHAPECENVSHPHPRIAIIGGGPGGYEAALVAAQLGAEVTVVERDGLGGACVLTDCVPSKTLIATAEMMAGLESSSSLGIRVNSDGNEVGLLDAARLYARVRSLARAQSADVASRLSAEGVKVIGGPGHLVGPRVVVAGDTRIEADAVLIATGAEPRILPGSEPDGERILNWRQLYDLESLPEELIVVGSGVTGAEFASAYQALGSQVTLVSSRDRVLPHEDADAAVLVEDVFRRRGMTVLGRSRAERVTRSENGVVVTLADGRTIRGTHCLLTVGMVPSTSGLGLAEAGVQVDDRGFVLVDKVSRTTAPGVYAAGDCTGVLMLASVAAMQGRIAMWHALGEAVKPLRLANVAATIFTDPEIATVGLPERAVAAGEVPDALVVKLPLATNARAKMQGFRDGFVKLISRRSTGTVLGGVIVAPRASELILAVSLAVERNLTVDHLAQTFAVYPSLSGSVTEAARKLMQPIEVID